MTDKRVFLFKYLGDGQPKTVRVQAESVEEAAEQAAVMDGAEVDQDFRPRRLRWWRLWSWLRRRPVAIEVTRKPCLLCRRMLRPAFDEDRKWRHRQPDGGGELSVSFNFGSVMDGTSASAVVCDECGRSLLDKMKQDGWPIQSGWGGI